MNPASGSIARADSGAISLAEIAEDVFQSLPVGVVVFGRDLRVVHRNRAAASLFCDHPTISETLAAGTVAGQYEDWPTELRHVIDSGRSVRYDSVVYTETSDDERLLNLVCTPLRSGKTGEVVGAILIAEDITRRASLERRLAVSERLAAVGKLAARVAHELNNPLDGIMRYVNLAKRQIGDEPEGKLTGYLDHAADGLRRMAEIISELLEFSRSSYAASKGGNANDVLEEAIGALSDQAERNGVIVAASFQNKQMPPVRGSRLFQVFCNLIKNAIDAMPDGGRLTITSAVVDQEVVIRFEDTGVGLPGDPAQVFEPFFTTKKPGKGTGLGLAICKDYVERLHGRITAANRPEGGAAFVIRIPVASLATEVPGR
jgi:signal transduction histidine kinase